MDELKLPKKRKIVSKASSWKRIFSFIIDMFIIQFVIFLPYSAVFQAALPVGEDFAENYNYLEANPGIIENLRPMLTIIFILIFAYFTLFEYKLNQTPGKMIMKLRLAEDKKEKLSPIKVIIRNLAVFPVFPFSLLWIIDPLYLLFTGSRLSDSLSKTGIVEEISI